MGIGPTCFRVVVRRPLETTLVRRTRSAKVNSRLSALTHCALQGQSKSYLVSRVTGAHDGRLACTERTAAAVTRRAVHTTPTSTAHRSPGMGPHHHRHDGFPPLPLPPFFSLLRLFELFACNGRRDIKNFHAFPNRLRLPGRSTRFALFASCGLRLRDALNGQT